MGIDVSKIIGTYEHPMDYNKVIYELDDGTSIIVNKDEITSAEQLASSVFFADSDGDGEGDTYIFKGLKNAQIEGAEDVNSKIIVYGSENVSVRTSYGNDEVTFLDSKGCSAEDDGGQNTYTIGTGSEGTVIYDSFNTNIYYNFGDATQINDYGGNDTYYSRNKTPYAGYVSPELSYDVDENGEMREKYYVCDNNSRVKGYYLKDSGDFYNNDDELLGNISDYVFINDQDNYKSVQEGNLYTADSSRDENIRAFVLEATGETAAFSAETIQSETAPTVSVEQEIEPEVTPTPTPSFETTPTPVVSTAPSATPSVMLLSTPVVEPGPTPTAVSTPAPTSTPTITPSATPTVAPSFEPAATPILSIEPTTTPSFVTIASVEQEIEPEATPSATPTITPSATPTPTPSVETTPTPVVSTAPSESVETAASVETVSEGNSDITSAERKNDSEIWAALNACEVGENYCILPNGVRIDFDKKLGEDAIRDYMYQNIWQDTSNLWHIENINDATIKGTDDDDVIIINNAENLNVNANKGDDTIIISGTCKDLDIKGNDGDDTIINNADGQSDDKDGIRLGGQKGDDKIINYGDDVRLWGDGGEDKFVNYGDNVEINDGGDYDIITDFGKNSKTEGNSNKLYAEGIDPKNITKDETAKIEIAVSMEGNDCTQFTITATQNGKTTTATILIPKENGAANLSAEELQGKIFMSQDGVLCFDGVDGATITGTSDSNKILVQNSQSVNLNGTDGNDVMALYNCTQSTVNGKEGDDMVTVLNDEELSKEDANTALGEDGKDTFFVNSKYATVDFGSDKSKDFLLSYNSASDITLKNLDTASGAPDSTVYFEVDENGNITMPSSTSTSTTAVPTTSSSSSSIFTGYDPFGSSATTTSGTSNYSPTGSTSSGKLFTGYDPHANVTFGNSSNYGSGGFSSYDFSSGNPSSFTFSGDPFTGLGLTSATDSVQKALSEAEAKKATEETDAEENEKEEEQEKEE